MSSTRDKLKRRQADSGPGSQEQTPKGAGAAMREKLERLVARELKNRAPLAGRENRSRPPAGPGQEPENQVWEKEYFYPSYLKFRELSPGGWNNIAPGRLEFLFGGELSFPLQKGELLFFDSETTGLSGGTGTIPFMLGFGYFEQDGFRVKIFTLLDLTGERFFLERVAAFLSGFGFRALVTYNGNCFDLPLARTRCVLNRIPFFLESLQSLDFLNVARRIWKKSYESRKLGFLGEELLGLSRDDDIGGEMIPFYYNQFLQSGELGILERIADHNALDLLGLALLLLKAMRYLEEPSRIDDEGVMLSLALLAVKRDDLQLAEELLRAAIASAVREEIATAARKELALLLKRRKLVGEALEIWRGLEQSLDAEVLHQLCVHYEHREKNFRQALRLSELILEKELLPYSERQKWEARLDRLQRKIAESGEFPSPDREIEGDESENS